MWKSNRILAVTAMCFLFALPAALPAALLHTVVKLDVVDLLKLVVAPVKKIEAQAKADQDHGTFRAVVSTVSDRMRRAAALAERMFSLLAITKRPTNEGFTFS